MTHAPTAAATAHCNRLGWKGHASFGVHAFASLHPWQQRLVAPDMSDAALAEPFVAPGIETPGEKMGWMCTIMDMVYYKGCESYATLPDGRWIPHGPPDANWQSVTGTGAQPCPDAAVAITEMLLERTIEAMRAEQWEEAIRHAGALGHYLQEPFTPGHAMDNSLFQDLFPDPDPGRHQRLHFAFDNGTGRIDDLLPPRLMGASIAEAAFGLQMLVWRGIREAKKLVPTIIASVYEGQPDRVREALLYEQARSAVFTTASAWHTAFCIAFDRFEPDEVSALRELKLTELPPYFVHHWLYTDVLPGCLVQNKRKIPIDAWAQDDAGRSIEQRVEDGFGMGGHMGVKWYVRSDVYPRFRCRVGLPSRQRDGQNEHTDCRLFIEIDEQVNRVYSETMEYRAKRIAEIPLAPDKPMQTVDVDIRGARSLLLTTQCAPWTDPETGRITFFVPHVAIAEPTLLRHDDG